MSYPPLDPDSSRRDDEIVGGSGMASPCADGTPKVCTRSFEPELKRRAVVSVSLCRRRCGLGKGSGVPKSGVIVAAGWLIVICSGCISLSRGEREDRRAIPDAGLSATDEEVK